MSLKKFLRPTKKKIILFIILAFLSVSFFIFDKLIRMEIYSNFYYTVASELDLKVSTKNIFNNELLIVWVIKIIFILIFDYFFSCLIIWIYDEVKKK